MSERPDDLDFENSLDNTFAIDLSLPPELAASGWARHQSDHPGDYFYQDHWCLHLYDWTGTVRLHGRLYPITPGTVHVTPPQTPMSYDYPNNAEHVFAHWRQQHNQAAPTLVKGQPTTLPQWMLQPAAWSTWWEDLCQIAQTLPAQPQQASCQLWQLLWTICTTNAPQTPVRLTAAIRHIDRQLANPDLTVPATAKAASLSHNQLTRLFKQYYDCTVVTFIRRRRIHRAAHLLRASTRSITDIAASVGMPDPHVFNKAFRREQGISPTQWRK